MDILDHELNESRTLLKEHARDIRKARVLVFILVGLLAFGYIMNLAVASKYGSAALVNKAAIQLGGTLVLLLINVLSYKKPFISLLTLTVLCCAGCIVFIIVSTLTFVYGLTSFQNYGALTYIYYLLSLIFQVAIVYFMVNGTVSARKYENLQKLLKNQAGDA